MSTVSDHTALLSGKDRNPSGETGKPMFVTHSFETSSYEYLDRFSYFDSYKATFQPLTETERQQALAALGQWDQASGIHFIEVPAGQGDIRFGTYDFSGEPDLRDAAAYAYFPDTTDDDEAARGGDIYLDRTVADVSTSDMLHVLLHEIGHAVGLKHPFEGDIRLDAAYDNTAYTAMSYTGPYTVALAGLDIAAIQSLYGPNSADGTQSVWSWDAAAATLTQTGGAQNDTLVGVSTTDVIDGQGGEDVLYGRGGADRLSGGDAHDLLMGDNGDDVLSGGGGSDGLWGGDGSDRLEGGADGDSLYGELGHDTLIGGDGDDLLLGGDNDDTLYGGSGNDILDGEDGNDILSGEGGNDTLYGGWGQSGLLDGGAGNDIIHAAGSFSGLTVSAGSSTLRGGSGNDTLYGARWDDRLEGGAGNDVAYGEEGMDTLVGGAGDDRLVGGAGDDTLDGGRGGETEGDTVDYSEAYDQVRVDLNGIHDIAGGSAALYHAFGSWIGRDTLKDIENVVGGGGSDVLTGNRGVNRLRGGAGDDQLGGREGADLLDGGAGNDTLDGGTERDRLLGGTGNDRLGGGDGADLLDGGAGSDRLVGDAGNDRLLGGRGNDRLGGGAGDDRLVGGAGDDTLDGGRGGEVRGDTADYGEARQQVRIDLNGMSATVGGKTVTYHAVGAEIGRDVLTNVEAVDGGAGSDVLIGDAAANRFSGGAGKDLLDGNDGADVLNGGDGGDRLIGGAGDDVLLGGAGNDRLIGEAGDDRLVGGAGDDLLDGRRGGETRGDTADYGAVTAKLQVDLNGMRATVDGKTVTYHATGAGIGRDVLTNVENVTGGSGADALFGNAVANRLTGGDGNDTLKGGGGADILTGGAGADRFVFDTALAADNVDDIRDFTVGTDLLLLDDDVFTALKAGRLGEGRFHAGAAAHDADDRLIFDAKTESLFYDADGTGAGAQVKIATLDKVAALSASDFLIVV